MLGTLTLAVSPALAEKGYLAGTPASFGTPGAAAGQLEGPEGVAVNDATHDVYVADTGNHRVDQFAADGTFVRAWGWGVLNGLPELQTCTASTGCEKGVESAGPGGFERPAFVAVDNSAAGASKGDVYVGDTGDNTVTKFSESGVLVKAWGTEGQLKETTGGAVFGLLEGVAVDVSGNLWVYEEAANLDEFSDSGIFEPAKSFNTGFGVRPSLVIDSKDNAYVVDGEEVIKFVADEEAGRFARGQDTLAINPLTNNFFVDQGASIEEYGPFGEPESKPIETFSGKGLSESHGIAVNGTSATLYASERGAGNVEIFDYVPLPATVEREYFSEVGPITAQVSAQVDAHGEPTTYRIEYGTGSVEEHSTPEASAGAASTPVTVSQELGGLQPDTEYHFRVVATNAFGSIPGAEEAFTTFPPSTAALPDDRAYELVSNFPAGTDDEAYVPSLSEGYINLIEHGLQTGVPFGVSADGEKVVYAGDPPPTGGDGLVGESEGNEWLASRNAAGGWISTDLTPSIRSAFYRAFSTDFSVGIVTSNEGGSLASGTGEGYGNIYSHSTADGVGGEYRPSYTGTPPYRSTESNQSTGERGFQINYENANAGTSTVPAFSDLLFEASDALPTANVQAVGGTGRDPSTHVPFSQEYNLYDSVGGHLYLVNVLPDGKPEADASFGQFATTGYAKANGESDSISADGSRIFWSALAGVPESEAAKPKALYVRENDTSPVEDCSVPGDACTVQLDASERGSESGGGTFSTASSDGSRVFFTDCRKLTVESTAEPAPECEENTRETSEAVLATGNDLYEYDFDKPAGERLTDLTIDRADAGGADVQGGVVGASEDGEYVYFAATGVLAGKNAEGKQPEASHPNLYLRHAGVTTFIATLSFADGNTVPPLANDCADGGELGPCQGDWQEAAGWRTARVTPDGHSLVFMSNQSLTGYDNRQQQTGTILDEVFLYEAGSAALRCVSCNPSGEAPVVTEFNVNSLEHRPIGGFIPDNHNLAAPPRVISEDGGRVFFDSGEPLSPTVTDGWINAYEWERDGDGGCAQRTGCVYVLSGGKDPENSYLIGSDASGADAFFLSRAELLAGGGGGGDEEVYDARVDGVQPPAPAACEGTGCQGVPPPPPTFATPASVTFNGAGNFSGGRESNPPAAVPKPKPKPKPVKCKKGSTKNKQGKCVKKKKKPGKKVRKSSKSNRGGRS